MSNLLKYLNKKLALLFFALVTVVFMYPLIRTFSQWGWRDWDGFAFWNGVQRLTMLDFHQIPLWNPYGNGGNIMLAHPHSSFLSPFFIFVLLFGVYSGMKIQMILHLFLGLIGMYKVSRLFEIKRLSACFSAIVFMLSSVYAAHMTVGHASWMPLAYLPWLFFFYWKSFRVTKCIVGAIAAYSLMFLGGSVDVLHITTFFMFVFALLSCIHTRSLKPLALYGAILVSSLFLCAVKLFPMLEVLLEHPRPTFENDGTTFPVLARMFLSRTQGIYEKCNQVFTYGWHEYAAYVGLYSLGFAFFGLMCRIRKNVTLLLTAVVCLFVAMGSKAPVNIWAFLHFFPVYDSQHVPSRYVVVVVFCIALFSGMGYSFIEERIERLKSLNQRKLLRWVLLIAVCLMTYDLILVNGSLLKDACKRKPEYLLKHDSFQQRYLDSWRTNYPIAASNSGVINSYEVLTINKGLVKTVSDEGYRGEAYLVNENGTAFIEEFTANKIVVSVTVEAEDTLVLNQNYFNGWYVRINGEPHIKAVETNGLIATRVNSGESEIIFYYLPKSFIVGSVVSISTACILLCVLIFVFRRRRNMFQGEGTCGE